MLMGLHHTAISTPDLERCMGFYCDLLGAELVERFAWDRGYKRGDKVLQLENSAARGAFLKVGKAHLEIFEFSSPEAAPQNPARPVCDHGLTHLCFVVDDCRSEYRRLLAAGMEFHCTPEVSDDGCVYTYGRDPDGNVVEVLSFLPGYTCPNTYSDEVAEIQAQQQKRGDE